MAAVSTSGPLCRPCSYNSHFKVEVCLRKPLLPIKLSSEQVALEMLCFCSQLDLLIRVQIEQSLKQELSQEELSEGFKRQAGEIIYQMNQRLEHLSEQELQLEEYLDSVGLCTLFPRVEIFMIHGSAVDMLERPPSDDYFPHIGKLNQLLVLSQQLEEDMKHLGSHKYIAHQLSAIYQVMISLGDVLPITNIRKDIEANFKHLKASLSTGKGSKVDPQLPGHHMRWVSELTQNVITAALSLSEELTEELSPVMAFVSKLS